MSAVRVPFAAVVPRDLRRTVFGFGSRVEILYAHAFSLLLRA